MKPMTELQGPLFNITRVGLSASDEHRRIDDDQPDRHEREMINRRVGVVGNEHGEEHPSTGPRVAPFRKNHESHE